MAQAARSTADARDGPAEPWRRGELLHRRACTVFGRCATVAPPQLPALASAFAEYLLAWRAASLEAGHPATAAVSPQRLHDCVARVEAALRRAEHDDVRETTLRDHARSERLTRLESDAASLLTATRDLLRTLETDRPAAHRMRLTLVAAWCRYDDALAALRSRAAQVGADDFAGMASLRDALLGHLESARSLRTQSGR